MTDESLLASAVNTLTLERNGIEALSNALDGELGQQFTRAIDTIKRAEESGGRVIITGMGKSGHIGEKVAATLASTGTPAFFVHPSEASHGDLGMVTTNDAIIGFSWSGETVELSAIINYASRFNVALIAVTSKTQSALARAADVRLILPKSAEACPHGLAPTTSTTMQLALGDALAIALLESKGFTASDFKVFHPGGSLGASLQYVRDLMHTGDAMPLVGEHKVMSDALVLMTEKSFGCLGVIDENGHLTGIFTDGDLRRHMSAGLLDKTAGEVMTPAPKVVPPGMLASKALEIVNSSGITTLFVTEENKPVGILHLHDLLRARIT
jgi:arabinose-5-phosphate isomerase